MVAVTKKTTVQSWHSTCVNMCFWIFSQKPKRNIIILQRIITVINWIWGYPIFGQSHIDALTALTTITVWLRIQVKEDSRSKFRTALVQSCRCDGSCHLNQFGSIWHESTHEVGLRTSLNRWPKKLDDSPSIRAGRQQLPLEMGYSQGLNFSWEDGNTKSICFWGRLKGDPNLEPCPSYLCIS